MASNKELKPNWTKILTYAQYLGLNELQLKAKIIDKFKTPQDFEKFNNNQCRDFCLYLKQITKGITNDER